MSDPLRTDGSRATDAGSDADRDAKIEQLLLVGLDHYFAADYEHAINVWTRALFLDRSHARARAYIERARSALAERQRESEELLQNGVAAFSRGDGDEARRLLQAAIDSGAPSDEALAVLDRLNRLETAAPAGDRVPLGPPESRRSPACRAADRRGRSAASSRFSSWAPASWRWPSSRRRATDRLALARRPRAKRGTRGRARRDRRPAGRPRDRAAAAAPRRDALAARGRWRPAVTCTTRWRSSSRFDRPTRRKPTPIACAATSSGSCSP